MEPSLPGFWRQAAVSEFSPFCLDKHGGAFIDLVAAAFMVPAFLLPPSVRCSKDEAIMQRIYASWTEAGRQPASEVNAFVFSLGASLRHDLWNRLGDIDPPPVSIRTMNRLTSALRQQIMTDWLIADPDAVINLAACWLQELHRQGGVIEKADCCVNIDWYAKIARDTVWHNDAGQAFHTIYRLTVNALAEVPEQSHAADHLTSAATLTSGLPDALFIVAGWILLYEYHDKPHVDATVDGWESYTIPLRLPSGPMIASLDNVEMLLRILRCDIHWSTALDMDEPPPLQAIFQANADGMASLREAAIARWEALPVSEHTRLLDMADALLLPAIFAFGTSQD